MPTDGEVVELEKSYWQALREQDGDAARRMTSDPCIVVGAQGVASIDGKTFVSMTNDPSWRLRDFTMSHVHVRYLRDGVAAIGYEIREELTVDGVPLTLEAADTSVWVRDDDTWRCALHTESLIGDPFGRDRQGAAG